MTEIPMLWRLLITIYEPLFRKNLMPKKQSRRFKRKQRKIEEARRARAVQAAIETASTVGGGATTATDGLASVELLSLGRNEYFFKVGDYFYSDDHDFGQKQYHLGMSDNINSEYQSFYPRTEFREMEERLDFEPPPPDVTIEFREEGGQLVQYFTHHTDMNFRLQDNRRFNREETQQQKGPKVVAPKGIETVKKFGWDDPSKLLNMMKNPDATFYAVVEDADGNECSIPVDMSEAGIQWDDRMGRLVHKVRFKIKSLEVEVPDEPAVTVVDNMSAEMIMKDAKPPKYNTIRMETWD